MKYHKIVYTYFSRGIEQEELASNSSIKDTWLKKPKRKKIDRQYSLLREKEQSDLDRATSLRWAI